MNHISKDTDRFFITNCTVYSIFVMQITLCILFFCMLERSAYGTIVVNDGSGLIREYEENDMPIQKNDYAKYPYEVKNVKFEWEAEGKVIGMRGGAKDVAYAMGYRDAFNILMERIVIEGRVDEAKLISDAELRESILATKVSWDRVTSKSYSAIINVHFNKDVIEAYLNSKGIRYSSDSKRRAIICPIMNIDGFHRMYKNTPVHDAFDRIPSREIGITNFEMIDANIDDMNILNHETVMISSAQKIRNVIKKRGASNIAILFSEKVGRNWEVSIRMIGDDQDASRFIEYQQNHHEENNAFWERALSDVLGKIDTFWKGVDNFESYSSYKSSFIFPHGNEKDRIKLENILKAIPQIKSYKYRKISSDLSEIDILYNVVPAAIGAMLNQNGVDLYNQGGRMHLRIILH